MSKNKYMLYALLVMLLWGTLFPVVKLGYSAYNVATTGDIIFFDWEGCRVAPLFDLLLCQFVTEAEGGEKVVNFAVGVVVAGVPEVGRFFFKSCAGVKCFAYF